LQGVGVILLQGAIPPVGGRGSIHHARLAHFPTVEEANGRDECCPYRRVGSPGKNVTRTLLQAPQSGEMTGISPRSGICLVQQMFTCPVSLATSFAPLAFHARCADSFSQQALEGQEETEDGD